MKQAIPILCVCFVLFAGCTSLVGTQTTTPTPTRTPTTSTPTPVTATNTPTVTPTATPTPESATPEPVSNPWRKEPIVIGVDQSADPDRNYTGQIIRAVTYWEEHAEGHTAWEPAFVVAPDEPTPDIEIQFVSRIEQCGLGPGNNTIGCAPVLLADSTARETEVVRVNMGLTNESTYRVVRHELGHVLGLEHNEGPNDVMAPYSRVYGQIIRVHFEFETTATHDHRDTEHQAGYAFEYYSEGADGFLEETVEFAVVEERDAADIVVEVNRDGRGSRMDVHDGQVVIELNGIRTDRRGWHIGYMLGFYFGASGDDELPPPFDNPESDSRTNWWH